MISFTARVKQCDEYPTELTLNKLETDLFFAQLSPTNITILSVFVPKVLRTNSIKEIYAF